MVDWAFGQGGINVRPIYHDPEYHCDSDCGYMDCRWLNCGCDGHTKWRGCHLLECGNRGTVPEWVGLAEDQRTRLIFVCEDHREENAETRLG